MEENNYKISIEFVGDFELKADSISDALEKIIDKLNLPEECRIIGMRGSKVTGGQ